VTTPLQINRYDRLVRRLMNLVGEGALVTGVLPDVFPTIDVEDLQTDGWGVAGWRPAMGGSDIQAAAAEFPVIQISNPAASGAIVVVEQIIVSAGITGVIGFNVHDALLATAEVSMRWRDRRFPTLSRPVTVIREDSVAGIPIVSPMSVLVLASSPLVLAPPKGIWVLVPGTAMAFQHQTSQSRLAVNFFWRERPVDPAELNI